MAGNTAEHASVGEIVAWCVTGMSGWWSLNVIIAELPFFVAELPEAERLGNLLAVCTQIGNLAPITFKSLSRCSPGLQGQLVSVIAFSQFMALAALLVCAYFWNVQIGGTSVVLLFCTVIAGGVGCMSNVTYWAAASSRPASCTRAMSVGMTFGGLVASLLSSCQIANRTPGHPRFEPFTFFTIAAVVQAAQAICFLRRSRRSNPTDRAATVEASAMDMSMDLSILSGVVASGVSEVEVVPSSKATASPAADTTLLEGRLPLPTAAKMLLMGCFGIYACVYTMPTLQPYIALGFPDRTEQQQLFLWMMVVQNICDVTGRLATAYIDASRPIALVFWVAAMLGTFCTAIFAAAERSWIASSLNYDVAVIVVPALTGLFYFSRGLLVTSLYLRARSFPEKKTVERVSMNMGLCGQMGALGANAVAFLLVQATASAV